MKIVQFQYVPARKHEDSKLFVLDTEGRIWFAVKPFNPFNKDATPWQEIVLPNDGVNEEPDEC